MNSQESGEIRELIAAETDIVSAGVVPIPSAVYVALADYIDSLWYQYFAAHAPD
jgi:hypothetical protein